MNRLSIKIDKFYFPQSTTPFFEDVIFLLIGGEINFLIGTSGIGKTTLLKILVGMIGQNNSNKIEFIDNGTIMDHFEVKKLGKIGYMSQTPSLVPWISVENNLLLPYKLNHNCTEPSLLLIKNELDAVGLVTEDMPIEKLLKLLPDELSLGMQARVALVRTLLYRPNFLLLDELFTGIDTINSTLIAEKIKEYVLVNNVVCLSVTHDIEKAISYANNIYAFNKSKELVRITKPFNINSIIDVIKK